MLDRIVTAVMFPLLASVEGLLLRSPSLTLVVISALLFLLAVLIQGDPTKSRVRPVQPQVTTGKVEEPVL